MFKPLLVTIFSFGLLLTASPSTSAAQNNKNNNKNDERREIEAVQKAQQDVNAAEKTLRKVRA